MAAGAQSSHAVGCVRERSRGAARGAQARELLVAHLATQAGARDISSDSILFGFEDALMILYAAEDGFDVGCA